MKMATINQPKQFCALPYIHTPRQDIFLGVLNIFLSACALLETILVLIAFYKNSSLYQPSKVMICCLAITDLCVGLISQPLFAVELLLQRSELQHLCYNLSTYVEIVILAFSACVVDDHKRSKCGQTFRSLTWSAIQTNCNTEES